MRSRSNDALNGGAELRAYHRSHSHRQTMELLWRFYDFDGGSTACGAVRCSQRMRNLILRPLSQKYRSLDVLAQQGPKQKNPTPIHRVLNLNIS